MSEIKMQLRLCFRKQDISQTTDLTLANSMKFMYSQKKWLNKIHDMIVDDDMDNRIQMNFKKIEKHNPLSKIKNDELIDIKIIDDRHIQFNYGNNKTFDDKNLYRRLQQTSYSKGSPSFSLIGSISDHVVFLIKQIQLCANRCDIIIDTIKSRLDKRIRYISVYHHGSKLSVYLNIEPLLAFVFPEKNRIQICSIYELVFEEVGTDNEILNIMWRVNAPKIVNCKTGYDDTPFNIIQNDLIKSINNYTYDRTLCDLFKMQMLDNHKLQIYNGIYWVVLEISIKTFEWVRYHHTEDTDSNIKPCSNVLTIINENISPGVNKTYVSLPFSKRLQPLELISLKKISLDGLVNIEGLKYMNNRELKASDGLSYYTYSDDCPVCYFNNTIPVYNTYTKRYTKRLKTLTECKSADSPKLSKAEV